MHACASRSLDRQAWKESGHNPDKMLRELPRELLEKAGTDAEKIYRLLEEKIIPLYYQMSEEGIPLEWVRLMKETMKSAASGFSARRMVKQYTEKFYSSSIKHALED